MNERRSDALHYQRRHGRKKTRGKTARGLFLDRDGVIVKDKHYMSRVEEVELIDGCTSLMKEAKTLGMAVVIITNQSGIERGYFSWEDYDAVTEEMLRQIGDESLIDGIYANGYATSQDIMSWRKPSPGMIYQAMEDLGIKREGSVLIGDRLSDIKAGARAGIENLWHVETGHGTEERYLVRRWTERFLETYGFKYGEFYSAGECYSRLRMLAK